MGHPDLEPARPAPASLPDLIRSGDADAFSGFREAHIGQVRAYCEVACAPKLVGAACDAAFLDFLGRVCAANSDDQEPKAVLLAATRSAAAVRFPAPAVSESENPPRGRRHPAGPPQAKICAAMPELLAARANGELRGTDHAIALHVAGCVGVLGGFGIAVGSATRHLAASDCKPTGVPGVSRALCLARRGSPRPIRGVAGESVAARAGAGRAGGGALTAVSEVAGAR